MNDAKKDAQYARSLIEASLDPLVTISALGKITDVNQASVKVTGVAREGLIGTDFSKYFTEPAKAQIGYEQVFERGFVADYPLTIRHVNGKLTDVMYNASLYKDTDNNVLGVFAAARDVTEQKWAVDLRIANKELAYQNEVKEKRALELVIANEELAFQNAEKEKRAAELVIANAELAFQNEEKEKRAAELVLANIELAFQSEEKDKRVAELRLANYARTLLEASLDPLVTISPAGKITDMNEAMVNIIGLSREKLRGTNFRDYFTDSVKATEVYKEVFAAGFVADYPLTITNPKRTTVLFNGSVYKDDAGNVVGAVIVARDTTEQVRVRKELTEAIVFAELATELAEKAKVRAERATETATNAVKAKQQFLSNMSHEIRTPMNAIIGFTKVLLKTEISVKQNEYLTAIKTSGDALIVLINDILDLAKVDAGKMTFELSPFNLSASISAMLHLFEPRIQEKNLELEVDYDNKIPEVLLGDAMRLHQIIMNLMSNAVKFTNAGKITMRVKLISETETAVALKFMVEDTGIGILESKIDSVFENFQQASSNTSRLFGGTGLGLAIVKQLVEQQGGTTTVTSVVDEGSIFSFTLSFEKTDSDVEIIIPMKELDPDFKNIRVLVVEDMVLNQLLMRTLLDDFGFEQDIAANGQIAIEKLAAKSYDIVLMDLQMPVMNGFETTDHIRNVLNSSIPIIALTADVTTVDLKKCTALGMDDYLTKPVDERLLYSKIISLVKKPASPIPDAVAKTMAVTASQAKQRKYVNLAYLVTRTKSNPTLMMEMIEIYIDQTPPLILAMKKALETHDFQALHAAVHKMIPSFSIMGFEPEFEAVARKVQEYAIAKQQAEGIQEMVAELEHVCAQACLELEEALNKIRTNKE